MRKIFIFPSGFVSCGIIVAVILIFFPGISFSQEEVASAMRRYKSLELSTGYYEEYEVLSRRQQPFISVPGVSRKILPHSSSETTVRNRTRLYDSHQGIKFYKNLKCEDCHIKQTKDIHTVRAQITCRQCHGGEPIASIAYYYSSMNPIRRHAYVCAKCHQGANASFATYVVHPPNPSLITTRKEFPGLFYAFWIMIGIAVGTFVVSLPHTALWGIRELFIRKEKKNEYRE